MRAKIIDGVYAGRIGTIRKEYPKGELFTDKKGYEIQVTPAHRSQFTEDQIQLINSDIDGFSKTKIILIVTASTQFGPRDAIQMVKTHLSFPAIESLTIVGAETNYNFANELSKKFKRVNLNRINEGDQGIEKEED